MNIYEKFYIEPRLSTFNKLCKYIFDGDINAPHYYSDVIIHAAAILNIYPDLIWLTPYDIGLIKRLLLRSFNLGYGQKICHIFMNTFDELRHKKLIVD